MLEGKEVDLKIGDVGEFTVDVDDKGMVVVELTASKEVEGAKFSNNTRAEVSIFTLLEKAAKASGKAWTEEVVQGLESVLGISKPAATPAAPAAQA